MEEKKDYRIGLTETEVIDLKEEVPEGELWHIHQGIMEKIEEEKKNKTSKNLLEEYQKLEKRHGWKKWGITATAAVLVFALFSPPGVSLAGKFYQSLPTAENIFKFFKGKTKQDGYRLDIAIEKEEKSSDQAEHGLEHMTDEEQNSRDNENCLMEAASYIKHVKIAYPKLQGYTVKEKDGWYHFSYKRGFSAGKDFDFELLAVDQTAETGFFVDDIANMEEETIQGHTVIYIERNDVEGSRYHYDTNYTKQVIILFEEEGYLIKLYSMAGMKKEELLSFSGKIALKECKKKQASSYVTLSEYFRHNFDRKGEEGTAFVKTIQKDQVVSVQETAFRSGIEYEVQNVQVLNNISELWKENGRGFNNAMDLWKNRSEYADKNGNLKPYIRETVENGDGITAPLEYVTASEKIFQKFVLVELRVKNTNKKEKESVQICLDMNYLLPQGDSWVDDRSSYCYNRPKIIRSCQLDRMAQYFEETEEGAGFYLKTLLPDEEKVYHIGYFVDQDLLSSMFLSVDGNVWTGEYDGTMIDIRQ